MTRWCAYALVVCALVCSGVGRGEAVAGDRPTTLCELSGGTTSVRKPTSGTPTSPSARRTADAVAVVPATFDFASPRTWIVEKCILVESCAERPTTTTTARAPPRQVS